MSQRLTGLTEIKAIALRQLAEGTGAPFSLSAIARELGLTSPALYRYVASRDDLVTELLADALDDFSAALHAAAQRKRRPESALRAAATAYRQWAHANPIRYQ